MSTTDDTVTVFDTARAAAIETLRDVLVEHDFTIAGGAICKCGAPQDSMGPPPQWFDQWKRHVAEVQTQTLLAARSSTTCERCKGNGRVEMLEHCPDCKDENGVCSGTVPGGSVLLDLVAEQVGYTRPIAERGNYPAWVFCTEPDDPYIVPVYVAREST